MTLRIASLISLFGLTTGCPVSVIVGNSADGGDGGSVACTPTCSGTTPICDRNGNGGTGACVGCLVDTDCQTGIPKCDLAIHTCVVVNGSDGGSDGGSPDAGNGAVITGVATMVGLTNHAGTTVGLAGTQLAGLTNADGGFAVENAPDGDFSMTFKNGAYEEVIPHVLVWPKWTRVLAEGNLYPLDPIEVPRAKRLLSDSSLTFDYGSGAERLSPDQTKILFLSNYDKNSRSGTLQLLSLSGGTPIVLGTGIAEFAYQFSPDSSRVFFLSDCGTTGCALNSVAVSSGLTTKLSDWVDPLYQLSPDGTHIAFVYWYLGAPTYGTLKTIPVSGGADTTIATGVPNYAYGFTPDSQKLVFLSSYKTYPDYKGTLQVAPVSGGSATTLANDVASDFKLSVDGSKVFFLGSYAHVPGQLGTLQMAPLAGGALTTFGTGVSSNSYLLSPDGSQILFCANSSGGQGGFGTLKVAPVTGSPITTLGNAVMTGVQTLGYAFTPDGTKVLFVSSVTGGAGNLQLASLAGATDTLGTGVQPSLFYYSVFSKDGSKIWFLANSAASGGDLKVALVSTGAVTSIASGVSYSSINRFSPDGTSLVFITNAIPATNTGTLNVAPVAGGAVSVLGTGIHTSYSPVTYSDDGTKLLFLSDNLGVPTLTGTLKWAPASGATVTTLGSGVYADQRTYYFSADGSKVVFLSNVTGGSSSDKTGTLKLTSVSGSPSASTLGTNVAYWPMPQLSPDATKILFVSDYTAIPSLTGILRVAPLDGGPSTAIIGKAARGQWVGNGRLVAVRLGTPLPYRHQDGLYVANVP
jgi:Tol biopolymer transport system component